MAGEEIYASDDEMMQDQDGWEDEDYDIDGAEVEPGWADESLILDPEAPVVDEIILESEGKIGVPTETNEGELADHPNWKRFDILEEAPLVSDRPAQSFKLKC